MGMIVNGRKVKTLYTAHVYPLTDDEKAIALMRSMRIVASDDYPVTIEIMEVSEEERSRLRGGTKASGCYVDISFQPDEKLDDTEPMVMTCRSVDFFSVSETETRTLIYRVP